MLPFLEKLDLLKQDLTGSCGHYCLHSGLKSPVDYANHIKHNQTLAPVAATPIIPLFLPVPTAFPSLPGEEVTGIVLVRYFFYHKQTDYSRFQPLCLRLEL